MAPIRVEGFGQTRRDLFNVRIFGDDAGADIRFHYFAGPSPLTQLNHPWLSRVASSGLETA